MPVLPFPAQTKPHITRLVGEIEAVIETAIDRDELTAVEVMGALEWAKMNVFHGVEDA